MFDYTKAAWKKIIDDFKRVDFYRGVLTQCVYIAYLIYAICIGSGILGINIALLALSVAYFAFYVYMKTREVHKQVKKTVKKTYKWSKRGIKLVNLGITIYGLSITANHFTALSLILAALMIVGWVLEILFEVIFRYFLNKAKLMIAGLEADYKNITKPARTVGNFFKKVVGKKVEPEPEPTKERETLDKIVAENKREKENEKVEKRAKFSLWLQDKIPFLQRRKNLSYDCEQTPAPTEEEISPIEQEEIFIDFDDEL